MFQNFFNFGNNSKSPQDDRTLRRHRITQEAVVTEAILPGRCGQVAYQGSWWQARCDQNITLEVNTVVYVVERQDLILWVETENPQPKTEAIQEQIE